MAISSDHLRQQHLRRDFSGATFSSCLPFLKPYTIMKSDCGYYFIFLNNVAWREVAAQIFSTQKSRNRSVYVP